MDAMISGRNGVALVIDGSQLASIHADRPDRLLPRHPGEIRLLIGEGRDFFAIEDVTHDEIVHQLTLAQAREEALTLTLSLLDSDVPRELRSEVAEELDNLFEKDDVVRYVESVLYAQPLPLEADVSGGMSVSRRARAHRSLTVLHRLRNVQHEILSVREAWDAIPTSTFGGERERWQSIAVREGFFRGLVLCHVESSDVQEFFLDATKNRAVHSLPNLRSVLSSWISPFVHAAAREHETSEEVQEDVFVSYSHRDEDLRAALATHLAVLKRNGLRLWFDRKTAAGSNWGQEIRRKLDSAKLFLALVSPDYLASDYSWEKELTYAFERAAVGQIRVVPIILRPSDWENTELSEHQALPDGGTPITTWDDRDKAFLNVVAGIRRVLGELQSHTDRSVDERVDIRHLPTTGDLFFGREPELDRLDEAWNNPHQRIISLVAVGGAGKTTLVKRWLDRLSREDYRGAQKIFGWSFYSQGTKIAEKSEASADPFIESALSFFGVQDPGTSSYDRGVRLAFEVRRHRHLLILDGIEPLQHPPGPTEGRLRDPGLRGLLKNLEAGNEGLCVVTTRVQIEDIRSLQDSVIWLDKLSAEDGARLLKSLDVKGSDSQLRKTSEEFEGHALALTLLGSYLDIYCENDLNRRALIPAPQEDILEGRQFIRVMKSYELWLRYNPKELAVLRMVGLFDRPATPEEIDALLNGGDPISGLTEPLMGIPATDWQKVVYYLRKIHLLARRSPDNPQGLDAHPMIREYFGDQLRKSKIEAYREGHRRLYKYHKNSVVERCRPRADLTGRDAADKAGERDSNTPEAMVHILKPKDFRQLLVAVSHACKADRHREALHEIYKPLIIQNHRSFHERLFGEPSALLAGISEFFGPSWSYSVDALSGEQTAFVHEELGHCLFLVGRLKEASKPLSVGIELSLEHGIIGSASKHARILRETYLSLGELEKALQYAEMSVGWARRTNVIGSIMRQVSGLGQVNHWMGRWEDAKNMFEEAEKMNSTHNYGPRWLYSYYGFWYCELLLDEGEIYALQSAEIDHRALEIFRNARERATGTMEFAQSHRWVIDIALDHLTIGRSLLLERRFGAHGDLSEAAHHLDRAVEGAQQAGQMHYLVRCFLARATLRCHLPRFSEAESDLSEALEIARSCRMKPFEVDCLLQKTHLGIATDSLERAKKNLIAAERIIREIKYKRREQEAAILRATLFPDH